MAANYNSLLEIELANCIDPLTGLVDSAVSQMINCPICSSGEKQQKQLFVNRGFRFVLCPDCGLIFANPMVRSDIYRPMYEKAESFHQWREIVQTESQTIFDMDNYKAIGEVLAPFLKQEKADCLDISMRAGLAQKVTAFHDWTFDFLDFSGPTRELGRTLYPEKHFYNNFDEILTSGKQYHVIISMEALEHFSDPGIFMQNIHMLLSDEGFFGGVLSNVESLLVRLLGSESPLFDGLYQKYFFHTGSLKKLFASRGFQAEVFKTTVSCKGKIEEYLNRMIPEDIKVESKSAISQLASLAESQNLGYKLIFAASKK